MSLLLPQELLASLVSRVTETMLGLPLSLARTQTLDPALVARGALLDVTGEKPIVIGLSTSDAGSLLLGSAMFSCPLQEVDDGMKKDTLGELLNMTAGQIRTALRLDQALGLPRAAAEKQLVDAAAWSPVRLQGEKVEILVWLTPGALARK